jgi:hypothetical protein
MEHYITQWRKNVNVLLKFHDSHVNTGLLADNVDGLIWIRLGVPIQHGRILGFRYSHSGIGPTEGTHGF